MDRKSLGSGFGNPSSTTQRSYGSSMPPHATMPVTYSTAPTLFPGQIPAQLFNNQNIPLPSFAAMTVQDIGTSGRRQSDTLQQFRQPVNTTNQAVYPAPTLTPARSAGPKVDNASMDERRRLEQQRQQQKIRLSFQASKSKTTNSDALMGQILADIGFEQSNGSAKQQETRSRPITPHTDPAIQQSSRERSGSLNITVQHSPSTTAATARPEEPVRAPVPDLNDLLTKFSDLSAPAAPVKPFTYVRPKTQPAPSVGKKAAHFSDSQSATNWSSLSGDLTSVFSGHHRDSSETPSAYVDLPPWCHSIASLPDAYRHALHPFQKRSNVDKASVLTLLSHSGLGKSTLEHIWTTTCRTHTGNLTLPELCAALGLVGLAQTNFDVQHLTIDVLRRIPAPPQPQLSFTVQQTVQPVQPIQQTFPPVQPIAAPTNSTCQFSEISLLSNPATKLPSTNSNDHHVVQEPVEDDFSDFISATPSVPRQKPPSVTRVSFAGGQIPPALRPPPAARPPTTKFAPPVTPVAAPQQSDSQLLNIPSPKSERSSRKNSSTLPPIPISLLKAPNAAAIDYSTQKKDQKLAEQGWGDWSNADSLVLEPTQPNKTGHPQKIATSQLKRLDFGQEPKKPTETASHSEADIYAALRELAPDEPTLPPLPSWNIPEDTSSKPGNPKVDLNSLFSDPNNANSERQSVDFSFGDFLYAGPSPLGTANVISPEEVSLEGLQFDSLATDSFSLHTSDSAPSLKLENLDFSENMPERPEGPGDGLPGAAPMQRTDVWISALGVCTELLREGCKVFNSVSDSKMLLTVLAKATEHINDLIEVYRVARRIYVSVRSFNLMDHQSLLTAIKSNEEAWANLVTFLSLAGIEPPPGSLDFKSSDRGAGDSATSLCGLCLLNVDDVSGKRRGSVTYLKAEVDGRGYHMPCANFWLNCVGDHLPGLDLK
ncbi:hypothetical protein RvY_14403 [Ramazzottius varieornatus]|uniref:Synergin gamma C-terminal domain-containing protein n=1 Tax=Ramazzottius varieornatus TaxID=947166 RepID=A0A1D1VR75_RAMVA|nr:hypothetical protein RvY_14403 [Ramazzottius varieornatus]